MNNCPLCQHALYHQPPPLRVAPPWRLWCDGCESWLCWLPTDETRQVESAPICPACEKPMALKSCKDGVSRWGCETWKACQSGMRAESARSIIDVPVYKLALWVSGGRDMDAAHFGKLWEEAQKRYDRLRAREQACRRWWGRRRTRAAIEDHGEWSRALWENLS